VSKNDELSCDQSNRLKMMTKTKFYRRHTH